MPGLIHNLAIAYLRRFPVPDPIGLGLNKNIVVRQAPTAKQIKRHQLTVSEFQNHNIVTFGTPVNGKPVLYFCHGGGYVAGLFSEYYDAMARLRGYLGVPIICPDYPMPNECDARETIDFTLAHFREVRAAYPNSPFIIAGDSAGGHLTVALTQALTDDERKDVRAIFPLFPVLDMSRETETETGGVDEFDKAEVLLKPENMMRVAKRFAGDLPLTDPIVSPIYGDLSNLPPVHIYSGDCDPLYPDAVDLETKLNALGRPVTHHVFKGYGHDFVLFIPTPDGRRGLKRIAERMCGCFQDSELIASRLENY